MSSACIYKEFAIRVPAAAANQTEDQYLLISLVGDNNCYRFDNITRARSWGVSFVGSHQAQIANALCRSADFQGEMLRWGNFGASGRISAQAYLRKMRRLLASAKEFHPSDSLVISETVLEIRSKSESTLEEALRATFQKATEHYAKASRYNGADLIGVSGNAYD